LASPQREIAKAIREVSNAGHLQGNENLKAKMTFEIQVPGITHVVEGDISGGVHHQPVGVRLAPRLKAGQSAGRGRHLTKSLDRTKLRHRSATQEVTMAKGQKRSGREPKKPKQNKLKDSPPVTALSSIRPKPTASTGTRNK
jgi:hypothetical protein